MAYFFRPFCPECKTPSPWFISRNRLKCTSPKCKHEFSSLLGKTTIGLASWKLVIESFLDGMPTLNGLSKTKLTKKKYLFAVREIRASIRNIHKGYATNNSGVYLICAKNDNGNKIYSGIGFHFMVKTRRIKKGDNALIKWKDEGYFIPKYLLSHRDAFNIINSEEYHFRYDKNIGSIETIISIINCEEDLVEPTLKLFLKHKYFKTLLHRCLLSQRGVRGSTLPLYLSEIMWKYNNRNKLRTEKIDILKGLLFLNKHKVSISSMVK